MFHILFLVLTVTGTSFQQVLMKVFNKKTGNRGAFIFSSVSVLFAVLFFLAVSGFKLHFTWEIVPYALGFALSYGTAIVMELLSIKVGSLSLSSLVISYSLIVPTFYGLLFLNEDVGFLFYIGLALLCLSLFLINSKHSGSRITFSWAIFAFLAFLGNGICSTVQMVQQKNFAGQYKSEVMILALLTVSAAMFVFALFTEKTDIKVSVKKGGLFAASYGLLNGLCNFLVMVLAVKMNASILYPVISAGGILLTGIISLVVYKEKLSRSQYLALFFGIVSVVLMNI